MTRESTAPGWNVALPVVGLMLLLLLVLYRDTTLFLASLWSNWEDGGYSHGYLVVLISFYIIYSERRILARMAPCPFIPALVAVAACVSIWCVAGLVTIQGVQTAILLPLVMSVTWVILGNQITLKLLLPLMFIGLAMPFWSPLLPLLQIITAESAFLLTRLYGIPAFMQDFTLHLPAGRLSIEEACSGLHYLLAGVTLGVFYAWLNYRRLWSGLLVVTIVAVSAILANVLRVFIIVVLAYKTDMQHPYVEDHLSLGWYLFGALVFLLLLVDLRFGRHAGEEAGEHVAAVPKSCKHATSSWFVIFSVTAALIAAGPAMALWVVGQDRLAGPQAMHLPEGAAGWQGPVSANDGWQPVYKGAITRKGLYHKAGKGVHLFVGYYPGQSQGAELINDLNRIGSHKAWQVVRVEITRPGQGQAEVIETEIETLSGGKRLLWHRYRVAGHYTTNNYIAKYRQLTGLLSGRMDAAVVAMATDVDNDIQTARARLADFLYSMSEPLARTADGEFVTDRGY